MSWPTKAEARTRARGLLDQARATYAEQGEEGAEELQEIDAWFAVHAG